MHIVRYLFQHKLALLLIVALFVLQAMCDLALPAYTSDIVDVGIQQSGIEDAVPEYLSEEHFAALEAELSAEDAATLRAAYELHDGMFVYVGGSGAAREALSEVLAKPLVMLSGQTPGETYAVQVQQAAEFIKAEYEALGVDVTGVQVNYLIRTGLMMLLMVVLSCIIHLTMSFFATRTSTGIAKDLRSKLFNAVVNFSQREINAFSAASLITRGTNDIQQVQLASGMMMRMVTYSVIVAIGGIICIARTNVSMTWTIVLAVIAVLGCMSILVAITMPKFKLMQKLIDKINLVSRENLTGVSVIRAFNREAYEEDRFAKASNELMTTQLFTARSMSVMQPFLMLVMNGVSVLIVWVGAHYVDMGTIQTGDLIAFITYAMTIISSFLMLGAVAIMLPRAEVAAARVDEVISTTGSVLDPAEPEDDKVLAPYARGEEGVEIVFDHVSFAYDNGEVSSDKSTEDSEKNAVDDVSFAVEAGSTVAIVGGTGSGKSTLLKLLLRFYDVDEGAIYVNGVDVRNMSQKTLRSLLAFVPQASYLFEGDVAENVSYGNANAEEISEDVVNRALSLAQADGFVAAKEDGIYTEVAQGGSNFSGGQRQRLTIARALAAETEGYLFDDSFSALDFKTDLALRTALKENLSNKTLIIVAQRLATVLHADKIIVLDEGKVAGVGTHEELYASCEAYQEIALSQLSEEELEGKVN